MPIALRLTLALGLAALLLSLAALTGLFGYAAGALLILAAIGALIALRAAWRGRSAWRVDAATAAVAAAALIACAGAVAPVTDDDALAYVVPIAQRIAVTGGVHVWADRARAMWPQSQEVLLAAVLRLGIHRLGLVTAFEWLLCVGALSALARRVCTRREHVWAAIVIACGCPVFAFQVASGKEDLLLIAATLGTAFCLANDDPKELAAAGLFAGIAAGAKYTGGVVAAGAVMWTFLRHRDARWRSALIVGACACVTGGLWYGLNVWRYGNPVAPFLLGARGTVLDGPAARAFVDGYGADRGLVAFVLTPLRIFIEPSLFGGRSNLYNPLAYGGLAALGIASLRRRHAALLFLAGIFYAGWFLSLHNARLLLPAAVLLAPAAADCLVPIASRNTPLRIMAVLIAVLSFALPPAVAVVRAARYAASPPGFLERESQNYADIQWMNTHLDPRRDRVASDHKVLAYLNVPWIFLAPTYQIEMSQEELDDPERLLAACRRLGITHLFGNVNSFPGLRAHLRMVYRNPASRLGGVRFFREPPAEETAVFVLE